MLRFQEFRLLNPSFFLEIKPFMIDQTQIKTQSKVATSINVKHSQMEPLELGSRSSFSHVASIDSNRTLTNSYLAEEDPDVPRPASGGDTVRPKGNPSRVFPRQTKSAAAASGIDFLQNLHVF